MATTTRERSKLDRQIDRDWTTVPDFIDPKKESDVISFRYMTELNVVFRRMNKSSFLNEKDIDSLVQFFNICLDGIEAASSTDLCLDVAKLFNERNDKYLEYAKENELFEYIQNSKKFIERGV